MPDFTDLPIREGCGAWDLNRFRIAFRAEGRSAQQLASTFINGFPSFLNSPAATVEQVTGPQGQALYKFHGKLEVWKHFIPTPHPDWVRVIYKNTSRGFTVQTLHRDTPDWDDASMPLTGAGVGGAGGAVVTRSLPGAIGGAAVGGVTAAVINRYHFLAGRRSWRLDHASVFDSPQRPYAFPPDAYVLETAAIERISIPALLPMKPLMQESIIDVWTNLLANFVCNMGLPVLSPAEWPVEAMWNTRTYRGARVHYRMWQFGGDAALLGSADGQEVRRLFTWIYG